jgi:hypothetical protein
MLSRQEIIDFNKVFSNENGEDYINRITEIPKNRLIDVASFLISFKTNSEIVTDHRKFLEMWFGKENNKLANEINDKINQYKREKSHNVGILNPRTNLKFVENVLALNHETNDISNPELEILLFKIYLALNEQLNKSDNLVIKSAEKFTKYPQLICLAIGNSLATFDVTNFNLKSVFICQVLKAIFLFEFLEEQDSTDNLLDEFYSKFKVENSLGFLQKMLPLAFLAVSSEKKEGFIDLIVDKDDNYDSNTDFLDNLAVNRILYESTDIDYLNLRANPLYKVEDGKYRVISPLFAIEKIFNGLYFLLKEINDGFDKAKQINLRQLITYDFSEKYILYKVLERTYKKKYFKLSGEQMKTPGAPDYYIRNGNKVFLFESKDILINAKIKESYDFEKYEAALRDKLYYDSSGKKESPKAVRQLANFAKTLLNGEFKEDNSYKPKSIKIYPIILLHNRQLDIAGLNNITNIWFNSEVASMEGESIPTKNLRRPTIMNIDTLLIIHEQLASGEFELDNILDSYQNWIHEDKIKKKKFKNEDELFEFRENQLVSFNMFIDLKYNWKLPTLFEEKGLSVITD